MVDMKKLQTLIEKVAARSGATDTIEAKDVVDTIIGADSDGDKALDAFEVDRALRWHGFGYIDRTLMTALLLTVDRAGKDEKLNASEACQQLELVAPMLTANFGVKVGCKK